MDEKMIEYLKSEKEEAERNLSKALMIHKAFDLINSNWQMLKEDMDADFIEKFSKAAIEHECAADRCRFRVAQAEAKISKAMNE